MLVEKAYAKLHGSYQALISGSIREAFEELTGGFADDINMHEDKIYSKKKFLWEEMLKWKRCLCLMGASAESPERLDFEGELNANPLGIVAQHAYSVSSNVIVQIYT